MIRSLFLATGLLAASLSAQAADDWRQVAVPTYTPAHFVQGQGQYWFAPQAERFARQAAELQAALARDGACTAEGLAQGRQAWQKAVEAWARLSTVAVGPVNERRSVRRIDFLPVRPARIAEAVAQGQDTELAGAAAKGFGAMEWLLWAAPRDEAHCAYALRVAREVNGEAEALSRAFAERSGALQGDVAVVEAMNESLNQWLGGVELLRMQWWVRPLSDMQQKGKSAPTLPRQFADQAGEAASASRSERLVRWETLMRLVAAEEVPAPGQGLVSLAIYLRGKGLNPLADKLIAQVRLTDQALRQTLQGNEGEALAARRLAELKALVENEVTPVLDIRVGFSDADGD